MLMIHTEDGHRGGYNEMAAVPVPEATKSYRPVANDEVVNLIKHKIEVLLGLPILEESYGLSCKDQQMFGLIRVDTGHKENALVIGVRNSYNKSLSLGLATGANVFVCDNLCFSGDSVTVMRKHTKNVWRDTNRMLNEAFQKSFAHYQLMNKQLDSMKEIPLKLDAGYELIGKALGYDILKPQQATVAMKDWRTPRHEEFSERNLFSMYNCFTEGLKKGPAGSTLDRHTVAHEWFQHMIPDVAVVV